MTYRGHVKDGVVVLDEALPEGTEVEVVVRGEGDADRAALVARGRELVRQARERNRDVADDVIEREVERAIDEVRRRAGRDDYGHEVSSGRRGVRGPGIS